MFILTSVLDAFLSAYTNRIIYRRRTFCRGRRNTDKGGSEQKGVAKGVPESCKGRLIPPWSHLIDVPRLPSSRSYCPSCSFQSCPRLPLFYLLYLCFDGIFQAATISPSTNKSKISTKSNFILRDSPVRNSDSFVTDSSCNVFDVYDTGVLKSWTNVS